MGWISYQNIFILQVFGDGPVVSLLSFDILHD